MIRVNEILLTTYCHATEDCEKVVKALKNLLPPSLRNQYRLIRKNFHGYYGNPITVYELKINNRLEEIIEYFSNNLDDTEKAILSATLDLRYDQKGNKVFIRVSKQEAFHNKIILYDSDDVIKITISFKNGRGLNKILEYLRERKLVK